MKSILKATMAIAIFCSLSNSFAYLTIKIGGSRIHDLSDTQKTKKDNIMGGILVPKGTEFTITTPHHTGFNFSIAGGWKINRGRIEIEWGSMGFKVDKYKTKTSFAGNVRENDIKLDSEQTTRVVFLMLNSYYDFIARSRKFNPYIGGGIGLVTSIHQYGKDEDKKITTNQFGYQMMAGVNFVASKSVLILLEYKFFGTNKGEFLPKEVSNVLVLENVFKAPIFIHSINLGITFTFA